MNPTILSPGSRFATPPHYGQPRSPSRSPSRQKFFMNHELDPLLSNLSPTSTLEALEATQAIDSEGGAGQNALQESVAAASTSERALGIRAALAGKKLKEWHRELAAWSWPEKLSSRNGFDPPLREQRRSGRPKHDHQGHIDNATSDQGSTEVKENAEGEEYWGGLPAVLAQEYEDRIDVIRDDMEALGVEDLKNYVRDAHLTSNSRRLSRTMQGNGMFDTEYVHLDDFTAVITATIMHALPIISRLNSLLMTWSVRLVILRQIPDFLTLLESTRLSMTAAWHVIGNADAVIARDGFEFTRTALQSGRASLEQNIVELGKRLDAMLDILEGREETIPEEWIDGMEGVEADFGNWVVETERMLMEAELNSDQDGRRVAAQLGHDSHNSEEKTESVSHHRKELPHINTEQAEPQAESQPKNLYALQSSTLGLPYSFGSDGQVDDQESTDFEVSKTDGEIANDVDMGIDLEDSPKLEGQNGFQPTRKNLPDSQEATAVEKLSYEFPPNLATSREDQEDLNGVKSMTVNSLEANKSLAVWPIDASSLDSFRLEHAWNASQTTIIGLNEPHSSLEPVGCISALSENPLRPIESKLLQIESTRSDETTSSSTMLPDLLSLSIKTPPRDISPPPQSSQLRIESTSEDETAQSISMMPEPLSISIKAQSHNISPPSQSNQLRIESTSEDETTQSISMIPEPLSISTKSQLHNISPPSQSNQLRIESTSEDETTQSISMIPEPLSISTKSPSSISQPSQSNQLRIESTDENETTFVSKALEPLSISTKALGRKISSPPQSSQLRVEPTSEDETTPSNSKMPEPLSISRILPSSDISEIQLVDESKKKDDTMTRPAPLLLKQFHSNMESNPSSDVSSDTSVPGSGTSEYFSNRSSPEIQQASMAEYFENPVEVTSPSRGPSTPISAYSRRSSLFSERGDNGTHENVSGPSFVLNLSNRRRASSFAPEISIPESPGYVEDLPVHREKVKSHVRVRSASLRSFEVIPRHEVRNITIRRSESYSYAVPGQSSWQLDDNNAEITTKPFPSEMEIPKDLEDNTPASSHQDDRNQQQSESAADLENELETFEQTATPPRILPPSIPEKSRHRFENVLDLSPGSAPVKVRGRKPDHNAPINSSPRKGGALPTVSKSKKNPDDQLEARISSILTEIPEHIRLKSGPEPDAPDVVPSDIFSDLKKTNSRSPALRLKRPHTSMSSSPLTLTPAHPKASRSRTSPGDPEIKLYHLHQSGKDVPVKLFVRLVGEGGERVMVRIGGGWADLGEYLKEYASHHGRRSTSDGRFEIQGLPQSQINTPISNFTGTSSPATSQTSRPGTPSTRASSSLAFRHPYHSGASIDFDAPMTPENPPPRQFEPTPGSIESSSFRPSSRPSSTDEDSPLGLAGPKTRRKEVSPSKQAWVDGMLDQARKASAEKTKGGEGEFGDLGKVGSTKRVFMRSRKE